MKNKHRIKQGLSLLLAGALTFTNVGLALPAFAEDAAATPETAQTATLDPDAAVLYADLPDAPAGSYIGSEGLPVATGQTKIGLSLWADGQLEQDSHLDPDALNNGDKTVTVPLTEDTDYAIVPLMAQVEYPADGSRTDVLLPENVTLLDYYGEPAQDTTVLHSEYTETSAAATGLYLLTDGDFTAQLVYTAPDGNSLTQNLNVVIDRSSTAAPPFADMGVAPYAGRPTPAVTSGRITKVAKVNATWLIWFNGEPAYCCTHGANGQPNGCPPYSYSHTSTVGADQCIPGDHYGNQIRIWGGLNQLSLDEGGDFPAVFCAEDEAELSVSDFCEMIYDDLQLFIMQHYPDSRAAALYRESAEELLNGVQTYTAEAGYYTYIYQPAASGWQTVALIGPAIEGEEPEPEPVPQEYYANWQAPAQTAGGSFDLTFTVNTDKYQLNTLEKVDGAVITVTPSRTGGSVDGGSWQMTPAGAQTITTSGHTQDDSFHLNGGDGSATWTVHYEVSKTSTSTLTGQEGPFTSQAEAEKNGQPTWRTAIRQDVDEAIQQSLTWRQFLNALERKGYEVRMGRKYPVLRPPGKERFVRFKTLGKRYTPEAIQTRILYTQSYHPYVENPPTIQHGRLHSGKKPHRKLTGLRALYYRYLYELGALPRKLRRPSYAVRQDAYKLDQRIRQMEFLSKNNINTLAQLETHRQALQTEIRQLLTKRKQLPKTDDVQSQCESVNTALKQLRQEERLCRKIAEHSLEVHQYLTEARRDRAVQQQREQERARDLRPDITTR